MSDLIPVHKPVLVRPLQPDEQEALRRHGCIVSVYPEIAQERPDLLKGHYVTFPVNTHLQDETSIQSLLLFPGGYSSLLIWSEGWRNLYPERSENGQLA